MHTFYSTHTPTSTLYQTTNFCYFDESFWQSGEWMPLRLITPNLPYANLVGNRTCLPHWDLAKLTPSTSSACIEVKKGRGDPLFASVDSKIGPFGVAVVAIYTAVSSATRKEFKWTRLAGPPPPLHSNCLFRTSFAWFLTSARCFFFSTASCWRWALRRACWARWCSFSACFSI